MGYQGVKMGGWVSENFIALSCVYKWVYTQLENVSEDSQYVEPSISYTKWTSIQCEKWLHARGLDKSGSASEK